MTFIICSYALSHKRRSLRKGREWLFSTLLKSKTKWQNCEVIYQIFSCREGAFSDVQLVGQNSPHTVCPDHVALCQLNLWDLMWLTCEDNLGAIINMLSVCASVQNRFVVPLRAKARTGAVNIICYMILTFIGIIVAFLACIKNN